MNHAVGTWAALLLADPSPNLRRLVLTELLHRPCDDLEVVELKRIRSGDHLVRDLVQVQAADGSWKGTDLGGTATKPSVRATACALMRLGYLGSGPEDEAVARGAEYLFSRQQSDGSWSLAGMAWPGRVDRERETRDHAMIPMQTAMPLRAVAMCGYASDSRAEKAYQWLLSTCLDDGAWPTGIASGKYGGVAGYRRIAHSRWGCRTNTTAALLCLALHPVLRAGGQAGRALDLLLGRESQDRQCLGYEVARIIGVEPHGGTLTYFARYDLALMLDLCWRIGATLDDERVADMVTVVEGWQSQFGLWQYSSAPQASRWVTFDLLRSLSRLDDTGSWVSMEPHTPFQAYPKRHSRY